MWLQMPCVYALWPLALALPTCNTFNMQVITASMPIACRTVSNEELAATLSLDVSSVTETAVMCCVPGPPEARASEAGDSSAAVERPIEPASADTVRPPSCDLAFYLASDNLVIGCDNLQYFYICWALCPSKMQDA